MSQTGGGIPWGSRDAGRSGERGKNTILQKMKNSGNEAKKLVKTNDVTFLCGAHLAHFARNLAPIWLQNDHKLHAQGEVCGLRQEARQ